MRQSEPHKDEANEAENNKADKPQSERFKRPSEAPKDILAPYINKPFPFDAFPKLIQDLAKEQLKGRNVPLEFTCFCALGIVAGVAGYYYKLLNAVENATQYANLYLIGSGTSSAGKSIALDPLLRDLVIKHNEEVRLYNQNQFKGNKPILDNEEYTVGATSSPLFIFQNATGEAIRNKMHETEAPMFSPSAEAGDSLDIIGGLYKQGGKNEVDFYNKAWDTAPFNALRATGTYQDIYINKACLSLLWLTQPYKIQESLIGRKNTNSSGFMARPIFFKADNQLKKETGETIKISSLPFEEWNKLLEKLRIVRQCKSEMNIIATDKAKEVFRDFYNELVDPINGVLKRYESILAKSREKACRVALNLAICLGLEELDEDIAKKACDIVRYSNAIILDYYSTGELEGHCNLKEKVDAYFNEKESDLIAISDFKRWKRIDKNQLEEVCIYYPEAYVIEKNPTGKGENLRRLQN